MGMMDRDKWFDQLVSSGRLDQIWDKIENMKRRRIVLFDRERQGGRYVFITPREREIASGELDIQPFYILDHISDNSDLPIHDIGCGMNIFKHFYNLVGIDLEHDHADMHCDFDDEFVAENFERFDNAISINAIHFCHPTELRKRACGFFDLIKPGGYGYLTVNIDVMAQFGFKTGMSLLDVTSLVSSTFDDIVSRDIDIGETIYYENRSDQYPGDGVNGSIRLFLRKNT